LSSLSQRKLDALGLPLAYVDRQQRYRFANSAFLEWLGKREEDVLGNQIADVIGDDVYQLYQAYVDAALAGERTGFVRQLVTPGQPPIWVRVDYYPDRSTTGLTRGFLATYTDVDHLKRLELEAGQREHRLRLVTDSVELPILYFDRDFRLRFANRPFADWIGIPADDLLGHTLKEFSKARPFRTNGVTASEPTASCAGCA
jgi:PAS domain S-box-containing protein